MEIFTLGNKQEVVRLNEVLRVLREDREQCAELADQVGTGREAGKLIRSKSEVRLIQATNK